MCWKKATIDKCHKWIIRYVLRNTSEILCQWVPLNEQDPEALAPSLEHHPVFAACGHDSCCFLTLLNIHRYINVLSVYIYLVTEDVVFYLCLLFVWDERCEEKWVSASEPTLNGSGLNRRYNLLPVQIFSPSLSVTTDLCLSDLFSHSSASISLPLLVSLTAKQLRWRVLLKCCSHTGRTSSSVAVSVCTFACLLLLF